MSEQALREILEHLGLLEPSDSIPTAFVKQAE